MPVDDWLGDCVSVADVDWEGDTIATTVVFSPNCVIHVILKTPREPIVQLAAEKPLEAGLG